MKIGQLAAAAGVSVQTVRYYERRGLLQPPTRMASGYRDYPTDALEVVRTIKPLQAVGFTLKEIKSFLHLLTGQPHDPLQTRRLVEAKLGRMDGQILKLIAMRDQLRERLATCTCCNPASAAPAQSNNRHNVGRSLEVSHA
jgi:MerR family mercuric resistance operon transcriptional regulator